MSGWPPEAARPQRHQKPLDTYPYGSEPIAEAKWFRRGCHAENGGTRQRPGSVPARKFFPVPARRATLFPSVRGLRRTRQNENSAGLRIGLHESSRAAYAENPRLEDASNLSRPQCAAHRRAEGTSGPKRQCGPVRHFPALDCDRWRHHSALDHDGRS
jgi:hypothetical protein